MKVFWKLDSRNFWYSQKINLTFKFWKIAKNSKKKFKKYQDVDEE